MTNGLRIRKVIVRAYTSPTLVFLAIDWPDGDQHPDFLGFSIQRDPGYGRSGAPQYLFNKIGFVPQKKTDPPLTSDKAPIQQFNWWDGGIDAGSSGKKLTYIVTPVLGTGPDDLKPLEAAAGKVKVTLPKPVVKGIGTYFNRAVVSSQSFSKLRDKPLETQMAWLANGIEDVIPAFIGKTKRFTCAIYHLTDNWRVVPALQAYEGEADITYFYKRPSAAGKGGDESNVPAKALLENEKRRFHPRIRIASIMHDKFLIAYKGATPARVLMGSMNFTPAGATVQANLVHTFDSPQMAQLYATRHALLTQDLTTATTATGAAWQTVNDVPGSAIRVFFSPEPTGQRVSIDTVVEAVQRARSSVMFCMFTPTDRTLLDAFLAAGDTDKIIYGLVNTLPKPPVEGQRLAADATVKVEVYNRTRADKKTVTYSYFRAGTEPANFLPELSTIDTHRFNLHPSRGQAPAVHIHHKFIIIDADTDSPTIYTGSANMSKNSTNKNDENLLEIRGNTALGQLYLAEFMRLYKHYRARAVWESVHGPNARVAVRSGSEADPLVLKRTRNGWVKRAYEPGTPDFAARTRLAQSI